MHKMEMLNILDSIDDLPTLPEIAMEVNRMLQNELVKIEDLECVIKNDPVISSKILRLSNCAFFGLKFSVRTIHEALMLIGFNTVRNAIVCVSVIKALENFKSLENFNLKDFWEHSISVAITGKELARQTKLAQPDDAFLAGLLHDIGKIVLIKYFPDVFKKIWERTTYMDEMFHEAEDRLQIAGHSLIGGILAQRWNLQQYIVNAIIYHERPDQSCQDYNLILVVHMANMLTNAFKKKEIDRRYLLNIHSDAMEMMKEQLSELKKWYPIIRSEIRIACQFFMKKNQ